MYNALSFIVAFLIMLPSTVFADDIITLPYLTQPGPYNSEGMQSIAEPAITNFEFDGEKYIYDSELECFIPEGP